MITIKELEETQRLIKIGKLDILKWQIYWNKNEKKIEVYATTNNGLVRIISSRKIKKKPKWVEWTIEKANKAMLIYCTAHRDEKRTSLPRHTAQLSRNMQSGDTNSATAYRSNTKRTGVSDRRGRKKGKAKSKSRKGGKSCANA